MASMISTYAESKPRELSLLEAVVSLYEQEKEIYRSILSLSRRQTEMIRDGQELSEIRVILGQKNARLDKVKSLERQYAEARAHWERKRSVLTGEIPARLQTLFTDIGNMIEEILQVEAVNDQLFMSNSVRI
jgi:FlgN protein